MNGAPMNDHASTHPARVVIADDECMFRTSLRQLLAVPPLVVRDVYGVDVGPGAKIRAMMPAMNPIRMIQRMCTGYLRSAAETGRRTKV